MNPIRALYEIATLPAISGKRYFAYMKYMDSAVARFSVALVLTRMTMDLKPARTEFKKIYRRLIEKVSSTNFLCLAARLVTEAEQKSKCSDPILKQASI